MWQEIRPAAYEWDVSPEACHISFIGGMPDVLSHINELLYYILMSRYMSIHILSRTKESFHIWMSMVMYEWIMSDINESCHTYEWAMSHMHGSCHIWLRIITCEWVMSPINESQVTCEWVMSHMWMRHVTYEWVISHMNESFYIWMSHFTYEWVMSH